MAVLALTPTGWAMTLTLIAVNLGCRTCTITSMSGGGRSLTYWDWWR
jgi:hypothetical protein